MPAVQSVSTWHDIGVSAFTRLLMDQIQLIALAFMAVVYVLKVRWLLKHPAGTERTPAKGDQSRGIGYAYLTLAMPWELESTRRQGWRYAEFVLFHIGVAVCILTTFVMPYAASAIAQPVVVLVGQAIAGLALFAGVVRMVRRWFVPHLRMISAPDDHFSVFLLNVWLLAAIFALPQNSEAWLILFFGTTAFFLVYVPFSKISHYLLWPFIRYYQGKHFGHRGVYPRNAAVNKGV
jgi:nitrate reductase gamma subunit